MQYVVQTGQRTLSTMTLSGIIVYYSLGSQGAIIKP